MTENWHPAPVDFGGVTLPDELVPLIELLAENVHNVWASERLREGWTYAPVRNNQHKQTPLLGPYQALPESEKAYDRNTVLETLRGIRYYGFEIKKITES